MAILSGYQLSRDSARYQPDSVYPRADFQLPLEVPLDTDLDLSNAELLTEFDKFDEFDHLVSPPLHTTTGSARALNPTRDLYPHRYLYNSHGDPILDHAVTTGLAAFYDFALAHHTQRTARAMIRPRPGASYAVYAQPGEPGQFFVAARGALAFVTAPDYDEVAFRSVATYDVPAQLGDFERGGDKGAVEEEEVVPSVGELFGGFEVLGLAGLEVLGLAGLE